jgi:hypothetical protein
VNRKSSRERTDDAAIAAEVAELTASPCRPAGREDPSALITAKKGERAAKKRNAELEPSPRASEIDERLNSAQPIINAILSNPKLRAEALRIASGTQHQPQVTTEQPTSDEDPDAAAFAEDAGFFLGDNVTPDVARARRVLDIARQAARPADRRAHPPAGRGDAQPEGRLEPARRDGANR